MSTIVRKSTLGRFKEAFEAQNALKNAGTDSKMHEVGLSSLIKVVAQRHPGLAFILLNKEHKYLSRGPAYEIVFEPLINNASKENLLLLFSIVKTLTLWDQDAHQENFFLTLSMQLLKKAIELNHETFIEHLLEVVNQKNTNERDYLEQLKKFSQVLIDEGKDPSNYSMPQLSIIETIVDEVEQGKKKYSDEDITKWVALLKEDYNEFAKSIKAYYGRDYNEFEKSVQNCQIPFIPEEIIIRVVEDVSILHYQNLLKFINDAKGGRIALLKIANKLKDIEREKALEIFKKVAEDEIKQSQLPL